MIKIDKKFTNGDKQELSKKATTDLLDVIAAIAEVFEQLDILSDNNIVMSSSLADILINNRETVQTIINKKENNE